MRLLPLLMLGELAPGAAPVLTLGAVVAGDDGARVGLDAVGAVDCTPVGPCSRLRVRSLIVGAALPGEGAGVATVGPPRRWSQAVNSRSEIVPSLFASTDSNGVCEKEPSFHSWTDITPSLFLSTVRNRSAGVRPLTLAPPRAELHSWNSLSEILPSPFRSTTVNGTGATPCRYHSSLEMDPSPLRSSARNRSACAAQSVGTSTSSTPKTSDCFFIVRGTAFTVFVSSRSRLRPQPRAAASRPARLRSAGYHRQPGRIRTAYWTRLVETYLD